MTARTHLSDSTLDGARRTVQRIARRRVAPLLGAIALVALLAYALSPVQPSEARPQNEGSCGSCHPAGPASLVSVTGLPAAYDPNTQYTITISVADTNGAAGQNSFSMDVTGGGTMTAAMQTDPNVEINIDNQQASVNDAMLPMHASSWQVVWMSPSSGQVTFTVNAVSATDTDTGIDALSDTMTVDSTLIPEFPTLVIPLFVAIGAVLIAVRATKKR